MKSIKGSLSRAFLIVILTLSAASLVVFVVNLQVIRQYKSISDTMIAEYRLIDDAAMIVNTLNVRLQSAGTQSNDSDALISSAKIDITNLSATLDSGIKDVQSRSNYLGFKASLDKLVAQVDSSLARFEQNSVQDYFADFSEAEKRLSFVRDNGTVLILSELKYTSSLRDSINRTFIAAIILSLSAIVLIVLACLLFVFKFSKRLTAPLISLTTASKLLATGDMHFAIDPHVLKETNEIGVLAKSFMDMSFKVNEKTAQLSEQVREVEDSKKAILNLLEDIDKEKKNAEDLVVVRTHELKDEKARLLASINSLSLGFIIADLDDKIILKNPAITSILDIIDSPVSLHDIGKYFDKFNLVGSCKECVNLNKVVEYKDISYGKKFLRIFCAPISDDVKVIGYVFLVEDVTEAKVMERSRDEFFAVASHELRTPLTAIRGNTEMILDSYSEKIVDTDMREMLSDINSSSIRLIDMVNDFLEVSRLEQGRFEMKAQAFDVADVITKVVRDLQGVATQKGLSIAYQPPAVALPKVFADKNRVEQVLVNLVGNSLKFTKEGAISIDGSLQSAGLVKVSVTDTGTGISEHNQTLLFRKFQQAGEQMLARDVTQSTGLGLYICKLIMSNMGGTVMLDKSELGKGSTFAFTMPIAP